MKISRGNKGRIDKDNTTICIFFDDVVVEDEHLCVLYSVVLY